MKIDILILTAKREEFDSVYRRLVDQKRPNISSNTYNWIIGKLQSEKGDFRVVLGIIADQGNKLSEQAVNDASQFWDFRYVIFIGIAGGMPVDDLKKGNVVISNAVFSYERGKGIFGRYTLRNDNITPPDEALVNLATTFTVNQDWIKDIRISPPVKSEPNALMGTIASGEKLMDSPKWPFFQEVMRHAEAIGIKVLAFEMEAAGVATAIRHLQAKGKGIGYLIIRGISDIPRERDHAVSSATEERDNWTEFATDCAASFAMNFIIHKLDPSFVAAPRESYLERIEIEMQKAIPPGCPFPYHLLISDNQMVNEDALIDFLIHSDNRLFFIIGRAGSGKSTILCRMTRQLIERDILPVYIDLSIWGDANAQEFQSHVAQTHGFTDKLSTLFRASLGGMSEDLFLRTNQAARKFLVLDGLNEIYDIRWSEAILRTLEDCVRETNNSTTVIVGDRLITRTIEAKYWNVLSVDKLHLPDLPGEVYESIRSKYSEEEMKLLQLPFILKHVIEKNFPRVNGLIGVIHDLFTGRGGLTERELADLSKDANSIIQDGRSMLFQENAITSVETRRKLHDLGIIKQLPDTGYQFDHQLYLDYLASMYLVNYKDTWGPRTFDGISLKGNSFGGLSMALEQLKDVEDADRFITAIYDWNWEAPAQCILECLQFGGRHRTSIEIETFILSMLAIKKFDTTIKTVNRVNKILSDFVDLGKGEYHTCRNISDIIGLVGEIHSDKEWFLRWREVFSLDGKSAPLTETVLNAIHDDDPRMGWTASNVIRRFTLTESQTMMLRFLFKSLRKGDRDSTIRWRIVHALGGNTEEQTIALFLNAIPALKTEWTSHGAARALLESAAMITNAERRIHLFHDMVDLLPNCGEMALKGIGNGIFQKNTVCSSTEWRDGGLLVLNSIVDIQKGDEKAKWEGIRESFTQFMEGRG
jgi:nucleoside phosphorylase/energy-coupling factor transporter ATP-binding protein EcfA2